MKNPIYLDFAATTPLDPLVKKAMMKYLGKEYGNPSSVHALGQRARAAIEQAREEVAAFLHCSALEIVFTSGATEANNLAIQGVVKNAKLGNQHLKPHVITSLIEHESVLSPIEALEREGMIEATYVSPNRQGLIDPKDVEKSLKDNTILISIQYANSEIGTIQSIAVIGKEIQKYKIQNTKYQILFHTDAVQAANFLDCNVGKLGVDLLTLSSHKVYGPKGVGVLYVKKGIKISPLLFGGGQEQGMRSGTENVAGIVGMAEAVKLLTSPKLPVVNIAIRQLRDVLAKEILQKIPEAVFPGSTESRLPNNIHVLIPGIQGRDMVELLDQKGIAVSGGSACSERSQQPSHVLLALGYSEREAMGAFRITLGRFTKKEDVKRAGKTLQKVVEQLRKNR